GRTGNKKLSWNLLLKTMQHSALSDDDECICRALAAVTYHFLGRAYFVGEHADGERAFRMCDDFCFGIFLADRSNAIAGKFDVNVAITLPEVHSSARFLHHPRAEVLIW